MRFRSLAAVFFIVAAPAAVDAAPPSLFGFGKADITPSAPLRLAGYPNRDAVSTGVDQALTARVLVMELEGKRSIIASLDAFGLPGAWTVALNRKIEERFGIPRSRVVLAATGTHHAPQLVGGPANLLREPLSKEEAKAAEAYTQDVATRVLEAIDAAIANLAPGQLQIADGGETIGPVILVQGESNTLRGILFQVSGPNNLFPESSLKVSPDWVGYAQRDFEQSHPDTMALAMIGTVAYPAAKAEQGEQRAIAQGAALATGLGKLAAQAGEEISSMPAFSFGYAGLEPIRPDSGALTQVLLSKDVHVRRHAGTMLKVLARMGRLPESYPCPVHVWRFGDELTMVFIGGVVVDQYRTRLADMIDAKRTWISSLADDAFGMVTAKETPIDDNIHAIARYFELPGPWVEETEDVLVGRAVDLWEKPVAEEALSPAEALKTFRVSPGFEIELVASEPLIRDPINLAFDADGRLWVVEMGDYPRGLDGAGQSGGRIMVLEDTDKDGIFDKSTAFLEGLEFPTGVMPYKRGALVSGAPEIFYAEDTDGDGKADKREVLYDGFTKRNPQHRANGFAYGLDNWIYVAANCDGEVRSLKTGKTVNLSGRDCRIRPETGEIEATNGHSQYVRCRDDVGHWFGNENWCPIWHYVFPDRYASRNPYVPGPRPWEPMQEVFSMPPVYPASRTVDRFNDLFTANRFTSACSPTIYRDQLLWNDGQTMALTCEPVHNLVHRLVLKPNGINFAAERAPEEEKSEFVASTDTWSRPTRVLTGPDGAIWIADMYRHVIEHPEWIPEAWQARLDLRAGADKGRIYRVYPTGKRPGALPVLSGADTAGLIESLASVNGWKRDIAQQRLIEARDPKATAPLQKLAQAGELPAARIAALCTLSGLGELTETDLAAAMKNDDPMVRSWGVQLAEPSLAASDTELSPMLKDAFAQLVRDPDIRVRFQLALSLGEWNAPEAGAMLGTLAAGDFDNAWMRSAVLSSASHAPESVLAKVLADVQESDERDEVVKQLMATTIGRHGEAGLTRILTVITPDTKAEVEPWHIVALAGIADAIERDKLDLEAVASKAQSASLSTRIERVQAAAKRAMAADEIDAARRAAAIRLVARMKSLSGAERETLAELLKPQAAPEVREAVVSTLAKRKDQETADLLLSGWRGYVPVLRGQVLDVLLSRPEWSQRLLDAAEQGQVPVEHIDAARRERLLGLKDSALKQRASDLLAKHRPESRQSVVEAYRQATALTGNPLRGAAKFQKTCSGCHELRGRGIALGANLAILQDKSSPALLEAILDPNKAVEAKFVSYTVATTDGRVLSGLVIAETASSITLAQADGKQEVILRVDIEELVGSGKSFMPEGLEKDLSPEDLADLFAFIQSQPAQLGASSPEAESTALGQWQEAGLKGFSQLQQGPEAEPARCWLGETSMVVCRPEDQAAIRWQTQAAPDAIEPGEKYLFRIPVMLGAIDQAATRFEVQIGEKTITFEPAGKDESWKSADGSASLSFLLMEAGETEVTGVLDLELPGSYVKASKPLELTLKASGGGRRLGMIAVD